MLGILTLGNKSLIISKNNGRSCSKNFGTLESLIALIKTTSYASFDYLRLKAPAITSTLLTALIPKS